MAVRIDRVEREFILGTAAEAGTGARVRADGRSLRCRVAGLDGSGVSFALEGAAGPSLAPREHASVRFDFRGQAVAFDSTVVRAGDGLVVLALPEAMYRSLSRRWTRVSKPRGLSVDFLVPDAELGLDCPVSEEWSDVELPEPRAGLDSSNLSALVDSFKGKAKEIAGEGRAAMYKDRGPADVAEEIASRSGRVLYVPSTAGALPVSDPYAEGRIVTQAMADSFAGRDELRAYLAERAEGGLRSGVWCPILYYRYAVGVVLVANGADRPWALDLRAVDLAWEFSRVLAWFLKRHGYFVEAKGEAAAKRGSVVDASPAGILAVLPSGGPGLEKGSVVRLRLGVKDRGIVCTGKVARRFDEGGARLCGIAFMDLSVEDKALLSLDLYGEEEELPIDVEAGA